MFKGPGCEKTIHNEVLFQAFGFEPVVFGQTRLCNPAAASAEVKHK